MIHIRKNGKTNKLQRTPKSCSGQISDEMEMTTRTELGKVETKYQRR